jgi:uncharacterized damage-inducible protein DinB
MHATIEKLFQYKANADDELPTALAKLDSDSRITGLAVQALSHTYVVDRIFAAHLRRQHHHYKSASLSQMPTLDDLSADLRASDGEYLDYVSTLTRDELHEPIDFAFTDAALGRMSREEILMHVITHGIGHRGQISAVMLLNSVTPSKDGFATYLHRAEARTRRRAA